MEKYDVFWNGKKFVVPNWDDVKKYLKDVNLETVLDLKRLFSDSKDEVVLLFRLFSEVYSKDDFSLEAHLFPKHYERKSR